MIEETKKEIKSRELALKLYDLSTRQRQRRPSLKIPKRDMKGKLKELGLKNFSTQLAEPRRELYAQLNKVGEEMTTADKVALLVMTEIPVMETSALLHKLSMQLALDKDAVYFSQVNQDDNCGSGCGCGCDAMLDLPYDEKLYAHVATKPFSVDPFNEVGIPEKERDALLISDFLRSYEELSNSVSEKVNKRYFLMGREFE